MKKVWINWVEYGRKSWNKKCEWKNNLLRVIDLSIAKSSWFIQPWNDCANARHGVKLKLNVITNEVRHDYKLQLNVITNTVRHDYKLQLNACGSVLPPTPVDHSYFGSTSSCSRSWWLVCFCKFKWSQVNDWCPLRGAKLNVSRARRIAGSKPCCNLDSVERRHRSEPWSSCNFWSF